MSKTVIAEMCEEDFSVRLTSNDGETTHHPYTVETFLHPGLEDRGGRKSNTNSLGHALELFKNHLRALGVDVEPQRKPETLNKEVAARG